VRHTVARVVRRFERHLLQRAFGFDAWHVGHAGERYAADLVRYLNGQAEADRQAAVEMGCGLGDILRHLRFHTRLGLDRDPRVLRAARLLALFQRGTDLRFAVFEFPHAQLDGQYNAIVMVNWIHLIPPGSLHHTIHRYFANHLHEGGRLVIDTVDDPAYTYNHRVRDLAPAGASIDHLGRYARQRDVWVLRKPSASDADL